MTKKSNSVRGGNPSTCTSISSTGPFETTLTCPAAFGRQWAAAPETIISNSIFGSEAAPVAGHDRLARNRTPRLNTITSAHPPMDEHHVRDAINKCSRVSRRRVRYMKVPPSESHGFLVAAEPRPVLTGNWTSVDGSRVRPPRFRSVSLLSLGRAVPDVPGLAAGQWWDLP